MSEIAACAHLNVEYVRINHPDRTCSDSWVCRDCNSKFWPESHSRQLWLEAAEVAGLWERSHSCNSHDNNPCCHVRTGAEIAKRLRAKAESTPKPSPALPAKENL